MGFKIIIRQFLSRYFYMNHKNLEDSTPSVGRNSGVFKKCLRDGREYAF